MRRHCRLPDSDAAVNLGMLEKIASKGVLRHKLTLFRNWAHDDLVSPMGTDTSYRSEWKLGTKFVLRYSGNYGGQAGTGQPNGRGRGTSRPARNMGDSGRRYMEANLSSNSILAGFVTRVEPLATLSGVVSPYRSRVLHHSPIRAPSARSDTRRLLGGSRR